MKTDVDKPGELTVGIIEGGFYIIASDSEHRNPEGQPWQYNTYNLSDEEAEALALSILLAIKRRKEDDV